MENKECPPGFSYYSEEPFERGTGTCWQAELPRWPSAPPTEGRAVSRQEKTIRIMTTIAAVVGASGLLYLLEHSPVQAAPPTFEPNSTDLSYEPIQETSFPDQAWHTSLDSERVRVPSNDSLWLTREPLKETLQNKPDVLQPPSTNKVFIKIGSSISGAETREGFMKNPPPSFNKVLKALGTTKEDVSPLLPSPLLVGIKNKEAKAVMTRWLQVLLPEPFKSQGEMIKMLEKNSAIQEAIKTGMIETIEPEGIYSLSDTPMSNKIFLPSVSNNFSPRHAAELGQWFIQAVGADKADLTDDGNRLFIAVLDGGNTLYGESASPQWANPGEIPGDRIDNDGDGFVDNVGDWNTITDTPDVEDGVGHGMTVNEVLGVLAKDTKVLNIKVCDSRGCYAGDIIEGLAYALLAQQWSPDNQVRSILNLSLGGPSSEVFSDMLSTVKASGAIPVAAAGNDGIYYPGNISPATNSIAALAVGPSGELTAWSNWGEKGIRAPGENILLKVPPELRIGWNIPGHARAWNIVSGTSFSAPQVAALTRKLLGINPELNFDQIEQILLASQPEGTLRFDMAMDLTKQGVVPTKIETPFYLREASQNFTHFHGEVSLKVEALGVQDKGEVEIGTEIAPFNAQVDVSRLRWSTLSTTPGENGELLFDSQQFPDGWYVFRIKGVNISTKEEDILHRVVLINNTTVPIATFDSGYRVNSPQIFSHEGRNFVLFTANGEPGKEHPPNASQGHIYFYDETGKLVGKDSLERLIVDEQEVNFFFRNRPPAINNQGEAVAIGYGYSLCDHNICLEKLIFRKYSLSPFKRTGEIIKDLSIYSHTSPIVTAEDGRFLVALEGRIYQIGQSDLVPITSEGLFIQTDNLTLLESSGEKILAGGYILGEEGEILQKFPGIPGVGELPFYEPGIEEENYYKFVQSAAADITDDGKAECLSIVGLFKDSSFHKAYLAVWSQEGEVLLSVDLGTIPTPPALSVGKIVGENIIALSSPLSFINAQTGERVNPAPAVLHAQMKYPARHDTPKILAGNNGGKVIFHGKRAIVLTFRHDGVVEEDINSPFELQGVKELVADRKGSLLVVVGADGQVQLWRNESSSLDPTKSWTAPLRDRNNSANLSLP